MALRPTETHNITPKKLTLFGPKLCDSSSTNQIARFVNKFGYGKYDRLFDSIKKIENIFTGFRFEAVLPS